MLKLNTNISLETIQNCEQLQGVETEKYYDNHEEFGEGFIITTEPEMDERYPAPTIADVINSAEELFGNSGNENADLCKVYLFRNNIFTMCQQDASLEEVEKYIINNLKVI